jgi:hypothetical protein
VNVYQSACRTNFGKCIKQFTPEIIANFTKKLNFTKNYIKHLFTEYYKHQINVNKKTPLSMREACKIIPSENITQLPEPA